MTKFTDEERRLMRQLKDNTVFQGLLRKLPAPRVPIWQSTEGDETAKHHNWIYESGRADQFAQFMFLFKPNQE